MINKKGVSPIIGYVLLIGGVLAVSILIYAWLKTYVPSEEIKCPEQVSLFADKLECKVNLTDIELKFSLKNTGLFNLDGFFIHSASAGQEIATTNLVKYLPNAGEDTEIFLFNDGREPLKPADERGYVFLIPNGEIEQIESIEIIPAKFEIINGKKRFASCGDAKIKEIINCQQISI